ncbi:MAG: hypothetical protein ABSA46_21455 [Thermodesulfovibrionales bacterium]|jgi:uncharacterized protein (UPF0261 family)
MQKDKRGHRFSSLMIQHICAQKFSQVLHGGHQRWGRMSAAALTLAFFAPGASDSVDMPADCIAAPAEAVRRERG